MTELIKAAREWQSFDPDINCTCASHFHVSGNPLPNDLVCDRERAWRRYVKLRDTRGQFDIKNRTEFVPNRLFTEFPNRKGVPLLLEEKGKET